MIEIASSSESFDLHHKFLDFEQAGVGEYPVVVLRQGNVRWFGREADRLLPLTAGNDGIFRSRILPGLWLNPKALFARDRAALLQTVRDGVASSEHTAFVRAWSKPTFRFRV